MQRSAIPPRQFSGVNKPMVPVKGLAAGGYYGNMVTGTALGNPGTPDANPLGGPQNPSASGSGTTPDNPLGAASWTPPTGFQTYGNGPGSTAKAPGSPPAGGDYFAAGSGVGSGGNFSGFTDIGSGYSSNGNYTSTEGNASGGYGFNGGKPAEMLSKGGAVRALDLGGDPGSDPDAGDQDNPMGPGGDVDVGSILGWGRQSMGLPSDLTGATKTASNWFSGSDKLTDAVGGKPASGAPVAGAAGGDSGSGQAIPQSQVADQWYRTHPQDAPAGWVDPQTQQANPTPTVPAQAAGGKVKALEAGGDTTNPSGNPFTSPGGNINSFDDGGGVPQQGAPQTGADMTNPAAAGQPAPPTPQPATPGAIPGQGNVTVTRFGQPGGDQGSPSDPQALHGLSQYVSGVGAMPADQAAALLSSHNGDMDAALESLGGNKQAQFALMQYGRQQYNGLTSMAHAAMQDGSPEGQQKAAQAMTQAHNMLPRSAGGGSHWQAKGAGGGFSVSTGAHGSVNSIVNHANKLGMAAGKGKGGKSKHKGYEQGGTVTAIPGLDGGGDPADVTDAVTDDTAADTDTSGGNIDVSPDQATLYAAAKPYDFVAERGLDAVLSAAGKAAGGDTEATEAEGPEGAIGNQGIPGATNTPKAPAAPADDTLDQLFNTAKDAQAKAAMQPTFQGGSMEQKAQDKEQADKAAMDKWRARNAGDMRPVFEKEQNDKMIGGLQGLTDTQKNNMKHGRANTPDQLAGMIKQSAAAVSASELAPEAKAAMDAKPGQVVRLDNGDQWVKHPGGTYEMVNHENIDPRIKEDANALYGDDMNNNRRDPYIAAHVQGQKNEIADRQRRREAQADKLALANANNTSRANIAGQNNQSREGIASGNNAAKSTREGEALANRSGIAGQNNQTRRDIAAQTDSRGRDIAEQTDQRARDIANQNDQRGRDIANQNNQTRQQGQQSTSFDSVFRTMSTLNETGNMGLKPDDLVKATQKVMQQRQAALKQTPQATELPGDVQVHNGHIYMFSGTGKWTKLGEAPQDSGSETPRKNVGLRREGPWTGPNDPRSPDANPTYM